MKKVVLADSHEVYRTGIAATLSTRDEYRIVAQCSTSARLMQAVSAFPGCVAIVAVSLGTDLQQLRGCLEQTTSRAIAIVEDHQHAKDLPAIFHGVVSRDIAPTALLECMRQVTFGRRWMAPDVANSELSREDPVGMRVRNRLTPREMRVAAMLLQGRKNREISIRLGTSEQVIKNCYRSIYEKSGAGDRLELALFIHHHKTLSAAVAAVAEEIKAEELCAACSTAVA